MPINSVPVLLSLVLNSCKSILNVSLSLPHNGLRVSPDLRPGRYLTIPQGILTAFLVTCNCRVLKLYTVPRHKQTQQKYVLKNGCYKSLRDCEKGQYGVLSITNPNYEEDDRHHQQRAAAGAGMSDDEDVDIFKSDSLAVQHPLKVWSSSHEVSGDIGSGGGARNCQPPNPSNILEGREHVKRPEYFLGGRGECDKSFSCGRNSEEQQQQEVEDRILTPRMIKSNEEDTCGDDSSPASAPACAAPTVGGGNNKKSFQTPLPSHGKLSGALRISELPRRPLPSAV